MLYRGLLLLALAAFAAAASGRQHKICVPEIVMDACKKMVEQGKTIGVLMSCVPARDRIECISKVKDHEADFEAVEPEDMYIAAQLADDSFSVFKEIRTKLEPQAEFRYEAVSVIHKDLDINNVKGLRGLASCHTGVGRNVGYKIPITKLTKAGVLGPLSNTSMSPRENELKALSSFFSKGCLVGQWSPDPDINARWKQTYSNLCELCERPEVCDYPDKNSGYEGALRCLAESGGQVAWTKVVFVRKFFGLPHGNHPVPKSTYNPDDFAYFCPDGTKKPIRGTPCTWAARPWPGFMASTSINDQDVKELRDEIAKLNNLGESTHATWIAKVLTINNKTLAVDNTPQSPLKFLEKAKYKDVIERDVLEPRRTVRLCVSTPAEMSKCEVLKTGAYSRDIRPSLLCVKHDDCISAVAQKKAELVVLDAHHAVNAENKNLRPLLNERYIGKSEQDIVGAVRKGSPVTSMQELRGKRACLLPNNNAGYFGVIKLLLKNNLIPKTNCPYEKSLNEFFSTVEQSMDPVKCLVEGKGDVAFVPLSALHQSDTTQMNLLCPSGLGKITDTGCGLITIPPRMVMTSKDLSDVQIEEALQSLLSAANLYSKHPELFRMFGNFDNQPNVIFSNHADGMVAVKDVLPSYEEYKKWMVDMSKCNA
uniref:Transferrin n=1 Tax=Pyrrhocoris apterus TaxID=37000 RepID=M4WMH6_PYRAP|nr:transferrin [Pyrrhocoris apterus]